MVFSTSKRRLAPRYPSSCDLDSVLHGVMYGVRFDFLWPGLAGVISSAGLVGLFAQGMMVSSLLTFEKVSDGGIR